MPPRGGLYLLDVVPDGEVRFGFPNISDNAEIVELIACGCHLTLFTTGRGSVVGSAISPVIKICANPETYRRMADDMDVDAGRILEGRATLDEVGREIFDRVLDVAAGRRASPSGSGTRSSSSLTRPSPRSVRPACRKERRVTKHASMTIGLKNTTVPIEVMAELEEAARYAASGVRDPEVMRNAEEYSDPG